MRSLKSGPPISGSRRPLDLARVLLVHGDLAPRLALRTILQAGGYSVDVAATPAEAISKLDEGKYELVLSDEEFDSRSAGRNLLAYARIKDYRPAPALVTSNEPKIIYKAAQKKHRVAVHTENLAKLLSDVADLIGKRVCRRQRPMVRRACKLWV